MKQTFQYQYLAKPWMEEVLAIREKYLSVENNIQFNISQIFREKQINICLLFYHRSKGNKNKSTKFILHMEE